jgi:MFS family permease
MKKEKIIFEDKLIEKAKKTSVKEACAYSFMDGFGLRYITPYALAVGANNNQIGILSSLPSLLGNLSQIFSLKIMNFWTRKKIVHLAVLLQTLMWLALIAIGALYFIFDKKEITPNLVILIYILLIIFGSFGGPAWQSWMKDLVKKNSGSYFGNRSRIATLIALICMLLAGFILDYFKKTQIYLGFIIIFLIAFTGRFISSRLILKQYEPEFIHDKKDYFTIFQFIKRMTSSNFGKFVLYFSLVSLTVAICSPFFTVYMLKDLNFSYIKYMTVVFSSTLTTLIFVMPWGKFADKYGNLKVMNITGLFIPLIPFAWLLSIFIPKNLIFPYLILIEGLSGIIWAGFNLSAGNFIYDAVSRQKIAICATYLNIISSFGVLLGATLGGFISSKNFIFLGLTPILSIFVLSGILRFLIYISMNKKLKEVRIVKKFKGFKIENHVKNKLKIGFEGIFKRSNSLTKFFESIINETT